MSQELTIASDYFIVRSNAKVRTLRGAMQGKNWILHRFGRSTTLSLAWSNVCRNMFNPLRVDHRTGIGKTRTDACRLFSDIISRHSVQRVS